MIRASIALLTASIALLAARPAAAGLVLSFDQSVYTIAGVGQTVDVQVLLSEDANGSPIAAGNELASGGVTLSFATAGAAVVPSPADVTPGSAWDVGLVDFSTDGANTLVALGLNSLLGISDLSSPLLLGTFRFQAQAVGDAPISVITLGPGPSFITVKGDQLDPTNQANARIMVSSSGAVPEPSALLSASIAAAMLAAVAARRRRAGA